MKLLDRKTLNSDFNLQKKMQIDEGVVIAKKIDVLRETLVSLEAQHKKFIEGIRQDLITQTKSLEDRKSAVQGEIFKLEERRKELLKPLDDQWALIKENKAKIQKVLDKIKILEENLYERESKIAKTEKATQQASNEIADLKAVAEANTKRTTELRQSIEVIKGDLEKNGADQKKDFARQNIELIQRGKDLASQRKFLDLVKANLDDREKRLDEKEKFINDKYETLQRTIGRIKK